MTWTCTQTGCYRVNDGDSAKCAGCGSTRVAGLSEEERAALAFVNTGRVAARLRELTADVWSGMDQNVRDMALAQYRAVLAPLEAENAKLRERVGMAEVERSDWRESSRRWAAAFHEGEKREAELQAQLAQAQKPAAPADVVDLEAAIEAVRVWLHNEGAHWLEDAAEKLVGVTLGSRKPAPAGLPEVGSEVEYLNGSDGWTLGKVEKHIFDDLFAVDVFHSKANEFKLTAHCKLNGERKYWRRLPPAQTSRESDRQVERAIEFDSRQEKRREPQTHPMSEIEPAASPPGEASTENFCAWALKGKAADLKGALAAVEADIRVVAERETAKDKARIEGLNRANEELRKCLRETEEGVGRMSEREERDKARIAEANEKANELHKLWKIGCDERDAALAEVERLCKELGAEKEAHELTRSGARLLSENCDSYKKEVERLKGELARARLDSWRAAMQDNVEFVHSLMGDRSEGWRDATTAIWNGLKARLDKMPLFTPSEDVQDQPERMATAYDAARANVPISIPAEAANAVPRKPERKDGDPSAKGAG